MPINVGHFMGQLGEAQSDALGGQFRRLIKDTQVLLHPIAPGDDPPGLEGVFANALEVALLNDEIHMAVAGLQDICLSPPEGLVLAAVTQRVDPREAVISSSGMPLRTLPAGIRVCVDCPRRERQLRRLRRDLVPAKTRMGAEELVAAVEAGREAAAVVSLSDLRWLKKDKAATDMIATDEMVPAPGQGSLGILVRQGDDAATRVARMVHHREGYARALAERCCMRRLGWNVCTPAAAFAEVSAADGLLHLRAVVFDPEGVPVVEAVDSSQTAEAEKLGESVAVAVLEMGGRTLLEEARLPG